MMVSAPKPPDQSPIGNGCAITSKPKWIWKPCLKLFQTTGRCAPRLPRAADCGCCARTRGNVWPHSFCPPPNKSSKSGKSSRGFVNDLVNRSGVASSLRLDLIRPQAEHYNFPFPRRNASRPRLKPNCAPAKWAFAHRTCLLPRDRSPTANLIWKSQASCRWPKHGWN